MSYDQNTKNTVRSLVRDLGYSIRDAAREVGVSPATAQEWLKETLAQPMPVRSPESPQDGPGASQEVREAELGDSLLEKASEVLNSILPNDPGDEKQKKSVAVAKLVEKYLALQGRNNQSTTVVFSQEDQERMSSLLTDYLVPDDDDEGGFE